MSERIDVPEGDWRRVSMKYAWADLGTTLFWGLIIAAGSMLPGGFASGFAWWSWLIGGGVLLFFVAMALFSFARVRTIGYQLRQDDFLVRRGMLYRRFAAVPYGRMQMVDVTRGPLERMLGLSTLKFVTAAAASGITLPGLLADEADGLRDHLVAVAETRRAGL